MTHHRSLFVATFLGLLAGLALALDECGSTLVYLQTIPHGFAGLPRPANLDWIAAWAGLARGLAGTHALWGSVAEGALLGLGLIVFQSLNPAFRLTPPLPPEAESGAVLRQPIDRRRLWQIGGALVASLWLLGYFGAWLPWERGRLLGLLLAGPSGLEQVWPNAAAGASVAGQALLLAGLWLVWGQEPGEVPAAQREGDWRAATAPGAGPRDARGDLPRPPAGGQPGGRRRSAAAAALAGFALTPFAMPLAGWAQAMATAVLQGIGGAAPSAWLTYLGGVLLVYPLALGTAGWTAVSLARWTHFPRERRALGAGLAAATGAWLGVVLLLNLAGAGRFDDGISLAQAAEVPAGPPGILPTLTLLPGAQPDVGLTPMVSDQGLAATDASARRVWAYLRRRRFRTVHLFPALMHVYQCQALDWDSDRLLDTTLRSLSYNPHPGFCSLLIEKLAHCAATPKARAALARLQDPRWFHLPPEDWGLATLRRRLEPPGGAVRGRLWVNGAPARGMEVGLVEEALWAQLRGAPRALSHRLVVASSAAGAGGAFRLDRIPAGRYFLLARLPPLRGFWLPLAVWAQRSPGPIAVTAGGRAVDVGTVRLVVFAPLRRHRPRSTWGRSSATRYLAPFFAAPPFSLLMSHWEQQ